MDYKNKPKKYVMGTRNFVKIWSNLEFCNELIIEFKQNNNDEYRY